MFIEIHWIQKLLYSLLVALFLSCNISKPIEKAVETTFNSKYIPKIVMTKALVESTSTIYTEDSLKPDMPIFIQSLTALFFNDSDTVELSIDSVKAVRTDDTTVTFSKVVITDDSVIYKQLHIPFNPIYLGDTLNVEVVCKYSPDMEIIIEKENLKCLSALYVVENQTITTIKDFHYCDIKY